MSENPNLPHDQDPQDRPGDPAGPAPVRSNAGEPDGAPNRWRRRAILFLASQSITLFGSTLVQMAIVWYVTLETSSGAWVSALTVCSYLPQFLISFLGGVLSDRYSKKKLILLADGVIAAATLVLILAMPGIRAGAPLLGAILVVSVIRSLGAGIQTPAVNAVIPVLVPEQQLMRFNGINATMQSVMQFAAPAAAGAILSLGTLRDSLMIDLGTAAVGMGLLAFLAIPRQRATPSAQGVLTDMKSGVRYAFSDAFLKRLLAAYGLFIFLCVPAGFLATLLVSRVYGDSYWYLTAVELTGFAGMTAGGLLMGTWGGFKRRTVTLVVGLAAFGALAAGMGLSRAFPLYLVLMLFYGVALTMVQTAVTTLLQARAKPEMQGRIFGLMGSMYSGFLPIGMAVFGPLADAVPLQAIMVFSGAALLLMALWLRLDPRFFERRRR